VLVGVILWGFKSPLAHHHKQQTNWKDRMMLTGSPSEGSSVVSDASQNRLVRALRSSSGQLTTKSPLRKQVASRPAPGSVESLDRTNQILQPSVVSVGYEGKTPQAFIDSLKDQGVQLLVDVRQNPISRKPGFSKRALTELCETNGIEYTHERALGNPKENRDGFRAGDQASIDRYGVHLTEVGAEALERLNEVMRSSTIALLCFEADACQCHRTQVIDRLKLSNPDLDVISV
jgi:hypothetical protein